VPEAVCDAAYGATVECSDGEDLSCAASVQMGSFRGRGEAKRYGRLSRSETNTGGAEHTR
jgi:hypothetical protein